MTSLMVEVGQLEQDLFEMKHDLASSDPNQHDKEEVIEAPPMPTLVDDIKAMNVRVEANKVASKVKIGGQGYIFNREGDKPEEIAVIAGGDGDVDGLEDDLEDLIKKPNYRALTESRDCFSPLSRQSVHSTWRRFDPNDLPEPRGKHM